MNKKIIIFVLLMIVLVVGIFVAKNNNLFAISTTATSTFTPIYCNDYEFTCCSDVKTGGNSVYYGNYIQHTFTCDGSANYCSISWSTTLETFLYKGRTNCRYIQPGIFQVPGWKCDDEQLITRAMSYSGNVQPLDRVYVRLEKFNTLENNIGSMTYGVYSNKLYFCGTAGCTQGVPVSGADGCTFNVVNNLYSESGTLLKTVSDSDRSYTANTGNCVLSYNRGNRHICGNFEEQCVQDSDCGGHTYGNYECNGKSLQYYGCAHLNNIPIGVICMGSECYGKDALKDPTGNYYGNVVTDRCELKSTSVVQCCGDTDCGTNAFCDKSTWTCKQKVQCTQDIDCGVSQQCDFSTKQIKKSVCNLGTCGYQVIQSNIGCCTDNQCAVGWYCDTTKSCKESTHPKVDCPSSLMCCVGETQYFDRPCASGQECCNDNSCRNTCGVIPGECGAWIKLPEVLGGQTLIPDLFCVINNWIKNVTTTIGILLGILIFFLTILGGRDILEKRNTEMNWLTWVSLVVISLVLAYLIYYVTIKLWWLALLITIGYIIINMLISRVPFMRR